MTYEVRPTWMQTQEHGVIAEARTRAFLLDRFWILERSVDVDGADFIIQRRLTARSLLDRDAPRLGFVQSKFFKDASTTQYVHKEYVLDTSGHPRSEFFLLCHTGHEDATRAYFFSASDIAKFSVTPSNHSKPGRYALPGKAVLVRAHEVLDRGRVLGIVETALRNAEFKNNRAFLSWLLPSVDDNSIRVEYTEAIYNPWGDIPSQFRKMKELAKEALFDLDDVHEQLASIISTDDPAVALRTAEKLDRDHKGSVRLPDRLYDDEFQSVVTRHEEIYRSLENSGLLGAHASLRRSVLNRVMDDVVPRLPIDRSEAYTLSVRYVPDTLEQIVLEDQIVDAATVYSSEAELMVSYPSGVHHFSDGCMILYIVPAAFAYSSAVGGEAKEERSWRDKFQPIAEEVVGRALHQILEARFALSE